MNIVRYHPDHGPEIARLHRLALPAGFLSGLGDRFLAELYRAINRAPRSAVWVAVTDDGAVAGFLSGTAHVRQCYRNVLLRSGIRLVWPLLPAVVSRSTLARIRETLLYPFRASSGESTADEALQLPAELLSIAVSEDARGQGVGKRLVSTFEDSLRVWDITGDYRVVTDQSDPRSNAFYRATGFRAAGSFLHHGHLMSVYTRQLQPAPRAETSPQ